MKIKYNKKTFNNDNNQVNTIPFPQTNLKFQKNLFKYRFKTEKKNLNMNNPKTILKFKIQINQL